jgi:hypothetical protein
LFLVEGEDPHIMTPRKSQSGHVYLNVICEDNVSRSVRLRDLVYLVIFGGNNFAKDLLEEKEKRRELIDRCGSVFCNQPDHLLMELSSRVDDRKTHRAGLKVCNCDGEKKTIFNIQFQFRKRKNFKKKSCATLKLSSRFWF